MEIVIRQILPGDATGVAGLCRQLGYELSITQVVENIRAIVLHQYQDAFVAADGEKLLGWIGVGQSIQIESAPFAEIRGLVVDEAHRGKGIGKLLISRAKSWSVTRGNTRLRLRCNMKRTETHRFYTHLQFREIKEQKVFELDLTKSS